MSGAEESGTGGAFHLCRDQQQAWDRQDTVVLALDSLTNGQMVCFDEGELIPLPPPAWLRRVAMRVAADEPAHSGVHFHRVPIGASDATPFLEAGYDAMGLGCMRPGVGAPAHYHLASDLPHNLDMETFATSVDYAEALVRGIYAERLTTSGCDLR